MNLNFTPPLIFVFLIFIGFLSTFIYKAITINIQLRKLSATFKSFKKSEMIFRLQELNEIMLNNKFISDYWREFKETLIFNDSVAYKSSNDELKFETASSGKSTIYSTSDSNYYFNEDTLINSKMNHKLMSSIPGLLTGMGPLGTFLYIAIGFSGIDFSSEESTIKTITNLLSNVEIAALISIVAIGSALSFIIIERISYHFLCKLPLNELQIEINRLFDKISSEKFLIELIKESKKQNNTLNTHIASLPDSLKTAMDSSIKSHLTPYLENIVFGLNQQKEFLTKNVLDKLIED